MDTIGGSMDESPDPIETRSGTTPTERLPSRCPRCGAEVVAYGTPGSPYYDPPAYCAHCGVPLPADAKAKKEIMRSSILNAIEAETAERIIERGATDLGLDTASARRMVVRWARRQP